MKCSESHHSTLKKWMQYTQPPFSILQNWMKYIRVGFLYWIEVNRTKLQLFNSLIKILKVKSSAKMGLKLHGSLLLIFLNNFGPINCGFNLKWQRHIMHLEKIDYLPEACFPQTDEKLCRYYHHVAIMIENGNTCPENILFTRR